MAKAIPFAKWKTNPHTLAQVLFSVTNVPSMNGRLLRVTRKNCPPSMRVDLTSVPIIYLETANYNSKQDIVFPVEVDRFIDAAHARGMQVVAWYLPSFNNPQRDLRRSLAAIQRTTSAGGHFDSFGLDIEASVVSD